MPAGMRDDCEPPASRGREPVVGRSDGDPGQDRGERDLDFKLGERGTDAAVGAAAERQPGVGLGLAAHERAVGAARAVSRSPSMRSSSALKPVPTLPANRSRRASLLPPLCR